MGEKEEQIFIISIGKKKFSISISTPFVLIMRRLFYDDDTDLMSEGISNLVSLKEELKKIAEIEDTMSQKIPPYTYMPVSYLELSEYMKEYGVTLDDLKHVSNDGVVRVAEKLADSNDYDEALKFIELALKLNPNDSYSTMLKGSFLVETGKVDEGVKYLEKSVTMDSKLTTAYSILGDIYYNRGNYEKASFYWEKELEVSPNSRFTYFMIANAKRKMNDIKGAIEILEKLAKMDAKDILAKYELVELYRMLGEDEKAKKYEQEILNSSPFYSNDLEVWAKVQYKYGNYKKVEEFIKNGNFDENDPIVKLLLIIPYAKKGEKDKAKKLLEELKITSNWYYYGKREFLKEFFEEDEFEEIIKE